MNEIKPIDYNKHLSTHIYKYMFFQTYYIFVAEPIIEEKATDYYLTEDDAKKRQALEIHRMMSGTYKASNRQEGQASHFFKKFIDEKDIEFFVDNITAHQMHEEEFFHYLEMVEKEFPEKLI